ncbi:MAG: SAM-dependent methyltransferase, partial [Selenomonadaceae bacterium]
MGKITVIGIGPGSLEDMTPRARRAIEAADVIVGYNTYIGLIEHIISGKEIIGTAMMQEIDRCQMAVDKALNNKEVAVISSGDAGVYGM